VANVYFSLPVVANGVGAAVDISVTGVEKTIVVRGPFSGTLTLEISENAGASWCPLTTFFGAGKKVIPFAANRIRVLSKGAGGLIPFVPVVDIGSDDTGGAFVTIPAPAANGIGVPVNITTLGQFTTVSVQGDFGGGVIGIQISENGVDFAEAMTFAAPGCESKVMVGDFARAVSRGAKPGVPFTPVCAMGAINDDFAVSSIIVEDEGLVVGTRPILNFIGASVTAVDNPGLNRVDVTIVAAGTGDHSGWFWGNTNVAAAADTRFLTPGRDATTAITTDLAQIPIVRPGTLQRLYVRHNAAVGVNDVVYTVMLNGAPTAITVTLAAGAIGQASDLVNTVAVVAGDRVSLRATKALGLGTGAVEVEASLEIAY
jgi:hypothetical protein